MVWWQLILFITGLLVFSILLGLLVGYIILRIQKKPWPYAWPFSGSHKQDVVEPVAIPAPRVNVSPSEKRVRSNTEIQQAFEEFVKKRQITNPPAETIKPLEITKSPETSKYPEPARYAEPLRQPVPPRTQKSDLLIEIEADLTIATAPWAGRLTSFQTKVMDANRSRVDNLVPDLKEEITEAYTDMRLANTLVWLSMDVGHRSKDLDESYLRLCNKVAERLERIIPQLTRLNI